MTDGHGRRTRRRRTRGSTRVTRGSTASGKTRHDGTTTREGSTTGRRSSNGSFSTGARGTGSKGNVTRTRCRTHGYGRRTVCGGSRRSTRRRSRRSTGVGNTGNTTCTTTGSCYSGIFGESVEATVEGTVPSVLHGNGEDSPLRGNATLPPLEEVLKAA